MSRLNTHEKETEPVTVSVRNFLHYLLHCLICIYIVLILGVLPFYFTDGYNRIGTDKAVFFSQVSVYYARLFIPLLLCYFICTFLAYRQKRKNGATLRAVWEKLKKDMSITDVFVVLYGVSLLISYLCSEYKDTALWGTDWWFMGLYPQMILLASYFLVSRIWIPKKLLFFLMFPISGVVFFLGVLNRFGVYPINMHAQNAQFISTIGNINWYCGYLVTVFFGGIFLLWSQTGLARWQRILLTVYVAIGFCTLVTQGSSSGVLAMGVLLVVFFVLSASDENRMLQFWKLLLILSGTCLAVLGIRRIFPERITYTETVSEFLTNSIFPFMLAAAAAAMYIATARMIKKGCYFVRLWKNLAKTAVVFTLAAVVLLIILICINTLLPGSIGPLSNLGIFTFSPQWGSNRGATWSAGVMCFAEQNLLHKLVGVGPDCMASYLYGDGSSKLLALVNERFGTLRLTNAHNEWLTILVNVGILGFTGYVGMMITGIFRCIRQRKISFIAGAAGFCLLAYTVNNMFSFQQAMNTSTMFVIFGMGEAFMRKSMNVLE